MRKFLDKNKNTVSTVLCIFACILIFFAVRSFSFDGSLMSFSNAASFNNGWIITDGETEIAAESISRAETVEKGTVSLRNTLPEIPEEDYVICFRSSNERILISVEGEVIYSYGHDSNYNVVDFGSLWSVAELSPEMSGKTIEIEFSALTAEAPKGSYNFYLDHRNTIFANILRNCGPLIFCSIIGFILAILLIVAGIISVVGMRSGLNVTKPRLFLGIFTIISQIWALAQADLLQFIFTSKALSHLLTHCSLMLMPIFFACYLAALMPRWTKQYYGLATIFGAYLLIRLALYSLDILDIGAWLNITHILIFSGIFYAVFIFLHDMKSDVNPILRAGIIIFFAFTVITIAIYWANPYLETDMPGYALLMCVAIDTLLIFYYFALLLNHIYLATNAKHFQQQAYTDALTGVNNRAAFDMVVDTLTPNLCPYLTLFMLDLNNLKQVNDTLGHPAGDNLIKALVNYIKLAFDDIGSIYRYGGDEFVVVLETAQVGTCIEAQERLNRMIDEHHSHGGTEISVAIGMASRQAPEYSSLSPLELLRHADNAMYKIKAVQKSIPSSRRTNHNLGQIDEVTGILTFASFKTCVYDALSSGTFKSPYIINFDLNFFDSYNRLFGWDEGNEMLQKLASMALRLCGDSGFCAHGTADSFWVFTDIDNVENLTSRITEEARRFQSELADCLLFPSFGIYCISERDLPVSDMCSRATSAKKRIKGRLDKLFCMYDAEEHLRRTESMKLLSYMHKAMKCNEFVPFFQPKYSSDGKHLLGAETLVRWSEKPGSNASTADFTALFEQSGLILSLDWYMLDKTCSMLRRFMDAGLKCVPISVNFSILHVYEPDCVEHVIRTLGKYNIPAEYIGIELIRTSLVHELESIKHLVSGLRSAGVSVTMDDFDSTPYSLAVLQQMNIDVINFKCPSVDADTREFTDPSFAFILKLCKDLNIRIVIEGIELKEQHELLSGFCVDMVQGNLFSLPLPMQKFEKILYGQQSDITSECE